MERTSCRRCGEAGVFYDDFTGSSVCEFCGNVEEESALRSDNVAFEENIPGVNRHIQQNPQLLPRSSSTAAVALKKVAPLARRLKILEKTLIDQAKELIKQVLTTPLRHCRAEFVAGCCLYIVIRKNSKPIPLMDVASQVPADVYHFGKLYSKIVSLLSVALPDVDPTLYVERLCGKLQLGARLLGRHLRENNSSFYNFPFHQLA